MTDLQKLLEALSLIAKGLLSMGLGLVIVAIAIWLLLRMFS
jgi:hypothetical protein